MSHTYGIAADVIRRKRHAPWRVAGVWSVIFAMVIWLQTKNLPLALGVAIVVAAIIGITVRASNRQFLASAPTHSLTLDPDGIVIRDGAAESRLPYSAITSLTVNRRGSRPVGLVFVRDNGIKERLPPYERLSELIQELRMRAGTAKYSERRWIHV